MQQYYTPQEVADALKVNIRTIYKWIREGKFSAIKIGGVLRIPKEQLDDFLREKQN